MPAEPLPSTIIRDLITNNWNIQGGLTEIPQVIEVNTPTTNLEYDINVTDTIYVRVETPTETDDPIGNWTYTNRRTRVTLELYTNESRQRLYNMKQEIRRICNANTHSLTDYQRIWYQNFNELTQTNFQIWSGLVTIELLNSSILRET